MLKGYFSADLLFETLIVLRMSQTPLRALRKKWDEKCCMGRVMEQLCNAFTSKKLNLPVQLKLSVTNHTSTAHHSELVGSVGSIFLVLTSKETPLKSTVGRCNGGEKIPPSSYDKPVRNLNKQTSQSALITLNIAKLLRKMAVLQAWRYSQYLREEPRRVSKALIATQSEFFQGNYLGKCTADLGFNYLLMWYILYVFLPRLWLMRLGWGCFLLT